MAALAAYGVRIHQTHQCRYRQKGGVILSALKEALFYLTGKVYVPENILTRPGVKLLHISDTPRSFFPALAKLIDQIKPDYIVHTGDLVDNIKLALYPGSIHRYKRDVALLLDLLNASKAKQVYIVLGNHDDPETVRALSKRIQVFEDSASLVMEGLQVAISHYPAKAIATDASLCLFGHDLTETTRTEEGRILLNGISDINLFEFETQTYFHFPYPWGTDDDRSGKGRVGF